ncbi:MAG: hypothetical protein J7J86_10330, partial [Bacteroidales bacterium]|nr:hypothetical protein [Bacteroidales bacterium]
MSNLVFTSVYDFRQRHTYRANEFKKDIVKRGIVKNNKFRNLEFPLNLMQNLSFIKNKVEKSSEKFFEYIDNIVLKEKEIDNNDNENYEIISLKNRFYQLIFKIKQTGIPHYFDKINFKSQKLRINNFILFLIGKIKIFSSKVFYLKKYFISDNIIKIKTHKESFRLLNNTAVIKKVKPYLLTISNSFRFENKRILLKSKLQYASVLIVSVIY